MAERTDIYENWNPWHGCTKVSPGCKFCYVYRQDEMYGSEVSSNECREEYWLMMKQRSDLWFLASLMCRKQQEYAIMKIKI